MRTTTAAMLRGNDISDSTLIWADSREDPRPRQHSPSRAVVVRRTSRTLTVAEDEMSTRPYRQRSTSYAVYSLGWCGGDTASENAEDTDYSHKQRPIYAPHELERSARDRPRASALQIRAPVGVRPLRKNSIDRVTF